jgi:hypothetical protein
MQRQAFELCRTKCHPYRLPVACGPSFRGSGATNILKGGAAGKVVGKLLRDGLIGEVSVAFPAKMADYASLTRNLLMAGPARISGRSVRRKHHRSLQAARSGGGAIGKYVGL